MDLFHIKIFKISRAVLSIVCSIERNEETSHFIPVESCIELERPGFNPYWMKKAFEIQKFSLEQARYFVLSKLEKEAKEWGSSFSFGWDWDSSTYRNDSFVQSALDIIYVLDCEEEDR